MNTIHLSSRLNDRADQSLISEVRALKSLTSDWLSKLQKFRHSLDSVHFFQTRWACKGSTSDDFISISYLLSNGNAQSIFISLSSCQFDGMTEMSPRKAHGKWGRQEWNHLQVGERSATLPFSKLRRMSAHIVQPLNNRLYSPRRWG
jgi:hypothetical protein